MSPAAILSGNRAVGRVWCGDHMGDGHTDTCLVTVPWYSACHPPPGTWLGLACSLDDGLAQGGWEVAHTVMACPVVMDTALPPAIRMLLQDLAGHGAYGSGAPRLEVAVARHMCRSGPAAVAPMSLP